MSVFFNEVSSSGYSKRIAVNQPRKPGEDLLTNAQNSNSDAVKSENDYSLTV